MENCRRTNMLKFKEHLSARNINGTVFWDKCGLGHFSFTFRFPFRVTNGIKSKCCRIFRRGIILHRNNASSHTASLARTLVKNMKEILKPSPYSTDLTPSEFYAFLSLKDDLGGHNFEMEELKSAVKAFFQKQEAEWYYRGIQNWAKQSNKCFNSGGKYVEKLSFLPLFNKIYTKSVAIFLFFREASDLTFEMPLVCE